MPETLDDFPVDLRNALLIDMYEAFFAYKPSRQLALIGGGVIEAPSRIHPAIWADAHQLERDDMQVLCRLLCEQGLVSHIAGGAFEISGAGVTHCQDAGLVPSPTAQRHREAMLVMLEVAALDSAEKRRVGLRGAVHVGVTEGTQEIMDAHNLTKNERDAAIRVLESLGYVKEIAQFWHLELTWDGYEYYRRHKETEERSRRLSELKSDPTIRPQAKGHLFEDLFADILTAEGFEPEKRVQTPGQEHDIIFFRELVCYIVQCKWERSRTSPADVGALMHRVTSRADARGVFVSMKGFTKNAVGEAITMLSERVMLLYGPGDVMAMLEGQATFSEMMKAKHREATLNRRMLIDGQISTGK